MRISALWRVTAVAAIFLGAHGGVLAQAAPLAAGQVSGAEMQAWVDTDGLTVGGITLRNGCQFMAKNRGTERHERHVTVICDNNMAPWTVKGEGKVVGDKWCSKFTFPDGNTQDQCDELFKIGENKYEFRAGGVPISSVYRLIR